MLLEDFLTESSLSRIENKMKKYDCGIITAFRYASDCGKGKVFKKTENLKRNVELKKTLINYDFGITVVDGVYIENYKSDNEHKVSEKSFFVCDENKKGNLKEVLKKLGFKYEQDSILFIPKGTMSGMLIGTNKCEDGYPGYGKIEKLGKVHFGKKGEFYTVVNGRPFMFG